MKDDEVANKIFNDEIYFLFDLSGYTKGNRLGVFIQKPAPVQISWAGYLNTTGLEEMDYVIIDENIFSDHFQNYSEKIIKLPYIWTNLSTIGLPSIDKISKFTPAINNNYLTFGCFNNLNKVNRNVKNFILSILKKFKNSKIILKSDLFNDQDSKNYFYQQFFKEDIIEDRIVFLGTLTREQFLLKFNEIDILIDTFPYGGMTTSLEASWMCVPVLTREGNTFLSRCGVSINLNIGLKEFIYKNEDNAINLLKKFDTNYNDLQLVKEKLFEQKNSCKLFNSKEFANELSKQLYDIANDKR
jgi:predicted O-linked N-acetylglucosamine transferase (SPINDLY family)